MMAKPERDDLLLALGDIPLGLRGTFFTARTTLRRFIRQLVHGTVDPMLTQ
jgi:hypothetical protein